MGAALQPSQQIHRWVAASLVQHTASREQRKAARCSLRRWRIGGTEILEKRWVCGSRLREDPARLRQLREASVASTLGQALAAVIPDEPEAETAVVATYHLVATMRRRLEGRCICRLHYTNINIIQDGSCQPWRRH